MGKKLSTNTIREILPFAGLAAVIIILQIASGGKLLTVKNVSTLVNESFILIVGSCGMVFLMSQGNLDLSMMANASVSCCIAVKVALVTTPIVALPVALGCGTLIGALNGFIHTKFKIHSFITTIGMSFILSGLISVLLNSGALAAPMTMIRWDSTPLRVAVIILVCVAGYLLFEHNRFGSYCKAIGSNPDAARQSGVNINKVKMLAFMITGFVSGLIAFFSILRTGTSTSFVATNTQFNILISILLGGMSITGGSTSKFRAAIIGSLTMAFLSVGMTICKVDITVQELIRGLIFIVIVAVTFDRKGIEIIR